MTSKKMPPDIPADKVTLYDKLIAKLPGIERKGAASAYTSHNGHMFSFLTKDGTLALRLPKVERDEFLRAHKTKLIEQYGMVMKEYVSVPQALWKKPLQLQKLMALSLDYIKSLKPKPTTRKK